MSRRRLEKRYSSGTLRPGTEGYGRMNKKRTREQPEATDGCVYFVVGLIVSCLIFIFL